MPEERCVDGRFMRHIPQRDDPDFEVDIGQCPYWPGCGCRVDLPEQRDGLEENAMPDFRRPQCPECGAFPPPCPRWGGPSCQFFPESARELELLRLEQEVAGDDA
jgi:hypothetical protein